ncbi:hypothetical protein [Kaistia sp. MMO-174]|uniref:hypothetical protein n=1 Tax=Kaistia sp. MMO-174 TaxID=3081256 RepID=UPI003015DF9C
MTTEPRDDRAWWQTALHIGLAAVLFMPVLAILGAALALSSIQVPAVEFLFLVGQYVITAFISLYLPTRLLTRSHVAIAAAIWATGFVTLMLSDVVRNTGSDTTLWQWAVIAAIVGGTVAGAIAFVCIRWDRVENMKAAWPPAKGPVAGSGP